MNRLFIDFNATPDELKPGLLVLADEYPISNRRSPAGDRRKPKGRVAQFVRSDGDELVVATERGVTTVRYPEPVHAFRAIGRLLGDPTPVDQPVHWTERGRFPLLGVMLDCSRNAVHNVESLKEWLRRLALMGINALTLYTEDTYEVPGEPFFGYGRGPYTTDELKELDAYAADLGIEMFPCIQTLAHLEQALQWPTYRDMIDLGGILLAGDERTYAFVEKLIVTASAPFRSKRIHLGMDEAHGLGSGRYRQRFGEKRPFDIMTAHLERVLAITRKLGLKPMMWSDMWFRIGSKHDDYYDRESVIPEDVIGMIPKDVTQVYWDYYHRDEEFYREWIARHRKLGTEPLVAPGLWTWNHFWAYYPFAYATVDPCMKACKALGVKELLMTMWGDDGAEADFMSGLPVLQYYADHAYGESVDEAALRASFHGVTGGSYDDWLRAAKIDAVSLWKDSAAGTPNTSKWLLWEDPLLGLWQPQLEGQSLAAEYGDLADDLERAAKQGGLMDEHLRFPAQIARVLSKKSDLPTRLRTAYEANDRRALRTILGEDLPWLVRHTDRLRKIHRRLWFTQHKPQGWEVIEGRYGRLLARLQTTRWRLSRYLGGRVDGLPELEERREKAPTKREMPCIGYSRIATASAIK